MYTILRKILFLFPPEPIHYFSMNCFKLLCYPLYVRKFLKKRIFHTEAKPVRVFNLDFKNPVGLGAGFDKNAQYLQEMEILGFGFVEIGTVTPLPQKGNKKPRLFRLPKDKALINRMGFNNDGVEVVAERGQQTSRRRQAAATRRQATDNGMPGHSRATSADRIATSADDHVTSTDCHATSTDVDAP